MKMLTAYNQDVQRFLRGGCSTTGKYKIMDLIESATIQAGKSFEKLFPPKTKRKAVLDRILFLLSGSGICKVSSKTLAEGSCASVRTVSDAVKNLKETGEILVAGLADGDNKYVFVLKSHPNFKAILKEVFFLDELPPFAEPIADHIAEPEFPESLGTVSVEGDKTSSNYNNLINLKQEKNNYKELSMNDAESFSINDVIETEYESVHNQQQELEYIHTYYVNEFQHTFYQAIKDGSYHPELKANAALLGLRVGSNCIKENLIPALQAAYKVDRFLYIGGTTDSIAAYFSKIYKDTVQIRNLKRMQKAKTPDVLADSPASNKKDVPFKNWLENDLSAILVNKKSDLEPAPAVFEVNSETTTEELNDFGVW